MQKKTVNNTLGLGLLVLIIILVPFFLFHQQIDRFTGQLLITSGQHLLYTALILSLLLAADILLPVPSSMVSIGAGYLLGVTNGTIVSFVGMAIGCVIGYALGKQSINSMKWLNAETKNKMEYFFKRFGKWAIIIARPVPVLAEASVFFAGISGMNFNAFMIISSFANLGLAFTYAAVGHYAVSVNSSLLAFAGAILLPGIALLCEQVFKKSRG
ncbi:MAG: VTT domain-containing protein [Bacteroidota bacterium]